MKKYLSSAFISLGILAGLAFAVVATDTVSAVSVVSNGCNGAQGASAQQICGSSDEQFLPMMKTVINVLIFFVGIIAVIMIIVGGLRYTVSNGESAQIKSAKDTVMYSVIGLVVAIMAFAIVNFVIEQFS
jgi:hypothetical protein